MKFSIYEFSQSEIVKFNMKYPKQSLDVEDLLIFQWFKDFAFLSETPTFDGKKRKGMWSKEENGFKYYYVSYKALIEEFPIFSYTSERSIQRRFAKYLENETEINKHKKIWNLPGRENYLKEREMVLLEYLKLGAGALTNKEIKQEMENKLDEINSKYGITSYVGKEGA